MIEQALMQETIWFDQPRFEEAETMYQLHLVGACKDNGPKEPQVRKVVIRSCHWEM